MQLGLCLCSRRGGALSLMQRYPRIQMDTGHKVGALRQGEMGDSLGGPGLRECLGARDTGSTQETKLESKDREWGSSGPCLKTQS